ncbi:MAG TPA: peptidoglycan DD-metalloendopeptidase family protein [Geopsychrobacteraceae bacterium]|nr:peptidoglycan DD-metalloendopeptidase family protein [Geopsychrobacteraceae bacterium]
MASRHFTLMIIPDNGQQVRRMVIPRWMLVACLVVGSLSLSVIGYVASDYTVLNSNQIELMRLQAENSEQRQEFQRLAMDFSDLRQELVILSETDAAIRLSADLNSQTDEMPVGIGGAPETDELNNLSELQKQINDMRLAIDLRRQSQEEIKSLLNDQQSLSGSTPQGWPTKGWLTSYFGMRKSPYTGRPKNHEGLDIAANTGTPVLATADGVVARVETSAGYGKTVILDHGYGYRTLYAHNSKFLVKRGQKVSRGDKIAEVGNTGRSTGPHLHYEILLNSVPIDPRKTL